MDISETLAPKSDQLDAIELIGGPRTFTVERVSAGSPDQPVQVHFVGFDRVWRPSKGMRRVLAAGWGVDASSWSGKRVQLGFDPDVSFGRDVVGGTRVWAMSHLEKALSMPLLVKRGQSAIFKVAVLPDAPAPAPEPSEGEVAACEDVEVLRAMHARSGERMQGVIMARAAELKGV